MCTGPTHATVGLAAGLGAATAYGSVTGHPLSIGVTVVAGMLSAGGALLNDLDNTSTATSAGGPVTRWMSKGVRGASKFVFDLTASPADHRHTKGTHRGLTHTAVFVPAVGFGVWGLCNLGLPAILVTAFVVLFLALRGLPPVNRNVTDVIVAAAGTGAAWWLLPASTSPVLVGGAVAVGVASHTLADALTTNGVPLFAPLPLGGQRWRHVGMPRFLRFHTGGGVERAVMWMAALAVVVQAVYLVPLGHQVIAGLLR